MGVLETLNPEALNPKPLGPGLLIRRTDDSSSRVATNEGMPAGYKALRDPCR